MISFENSSTEEKNLDLLLSHQVDGIIADISETNKNVAFYQKALKNQTPVVFFDRIPLVSDFSGVVVNDEQASYHEVRYALQKGYKKPAHFGT